MKIAVIPARGGSKRIPKKNIKSFCGKPIIAWSLEAAISSELFDRIIVSTDDKEIAEIAEEWGGEIPFTRPAELSNDFTGTIDVISHATQWILNQGLNISAVCCIYPTAPFIKVADLKKGLELLNSNEWDFVFTATKYSSSIFRAFKQTKEGGLEMLYPEHFTDRSQDLQITLHDAGQFYWGKAEAWLGGELIFGRKSLPIVIPSWRVQDIDTEEDWIRAELLSQFLMKIDS